MSKKEKIIIPHGQQAKLAEVFGCTQGMVANALNYNRDSDLAKRIRHVALTQFGGQLIELST